VFCVIVSSCLRCSCSYALLHACPRHLFPFTGAATTVYCCLKALPSQHNLFFQDCAAIPNRLPQADDDAAAEQLYIARNTAAAVRYRRARLTADTRWSLSSRVVKLWECKGLSLVAATSLCPSHRDLPPADSPRCRLLCCSERLSLLCALRVMQLQFQHRVSHRKHVNRRRRLRCARARPCSRNLPPPPANGRAQSSTQSTTLKAAAAPAKCPRKYTEGSGRAL